MNIYTNTNSDLSCTWNGKTFTLLGFESITFTDSRTTVAIFNSNRNGGAIYDKTGGDTADEMSLTINIANDSDLIAIKAWAKSLVEGNVMLTHKQNKNLKKVFTGIPKSESVQNSIDATSSGKIEVTFTGAITRDDY